MRLGSAFIIGTVLSVLAVALIGWLNGYVAPGWNWTGEKVSSLAEVIFAIYFTCLAVFFIRPKRKPARRSGKPRR